MAHEEGEANPWHVWAFHIKRDQVGANSVNNDRGETTPQVEKTNEVEDGDTEVVSIVPASTDFSNGLRDVEDIFDPRLAVR